MAMNLILLVQPAIPPLVQLKLKNTSPEIFPSYKDPFLSSEEAAETTP